MDSFQHQWLAGVLARDENARRYSRRHDHRRRDDQLARMGR